MQVTPLSRWQSLTKCHKQLTQIYVPFGDPTAAQERLTLLEYLPLIDIQHADVQTLADDLIVNHLLPEKAAADARHVAVSAVFGVDYLLTWNCRHIANAETLPRIYRLLRDSGFDPPLVVTPEEFSGNV